MSRKSMSVAIAMALVFTLTACGDASGDTQSATTLATGGTETAAAGIRVVSPTDGASILENPPVDLVVLDVRTEEEFTDGHLEGAVMLDFYSPDFRDRLAELDPDVPYLIYCRSGNRSGQTRAIMADLGFSDVADVEGGILAWNAADLAVVTP